MSSSLFQLYSRFEDSIIDQFNRQPFYQQGICTRLSADQVRYYLLQIGFIAQNFVKWYETAKLGMTDDEGKEVVRTILRSEIPRKGPTHQDDRFADLVLAGIDPEEILAAQPTQHTEDVVSNLFAIVLNHPPRHFDLHALIILRVAGEILVAEQYKHIVAHWNITLGLDLGQSRFFVPHMLHDQKNRGGSRGHAGVFDKVLSRLICNTETLEIAQEAAILAERTRSSIHNQFVFMVNTKNGIAGIPHANPKQKRT